jgi:hypothetical protein
MLLHTLVRSERQRKGVELEVACLGFCQGKGEGREREEAPQRLTGGVGWSTGYRHSPGEWWRRKREVGRGS